MVQASKMAATATATQNMLNYKYINCLYTIKLDKK